MEQEFIRKVIYEVISRMNLPALGKENPEAIPIGISNRHIHLSKSDAAVLFGEGYEFTCSRKLSQPGQFAASETVMLAGSRGCIEQVRVLGPERPKTQVEISRGDSIKLGVTAPLRESGSLKGSGGVTVIGPKGTILLAEGVITAQRHIHMTPRDAAFYSVSDGQPVMIRTGTGRGLIFDNVVVRVNDSYALECHIDIDEANAAGVVNGAPAYLLGGSCFGHEIATDEAAAGVMKKPLMLVTEEIVRNAWKSKSTLVVSKETIYTPLVRDVIRELKVGLEPINLEK
ncbi:MAG TPA: phosphate propanoyltransferase [Negativicutes bacterium]|nr:phosphate propanoyltransferase [Negativicutes bacterium]